MREVFIEKKFRANAIKTIALVNSVIDEYEAQGYRLTVRQIYYQFVTNGWLDNVDNNYKWLAALIDDARKAGLIDWEAIEDRTRFLRGFVDPDDDTEGFLRKVIPQYYEDLWANQPCYCEVHVEKDAMVGVVGRAANRWRAPYFACRGYPSSTAMKDAGERVMEQAMTFGKEVYIFYLGDHDPSGIDMSRSNEELLNLYSRSEEYGFNINFERIALNMDQVRRYNPPTNPAKETDKRAAGYIREYGEHSWELDALKPGVVDDLIDSAIQSIVDPDLFETDKETEKKHRAQLMSVANNWDKVLEQYGND